MHFVNGLPARDGGGHLGPEVRFLTQSPVFTVFTWCRPSQSMGRVVAGLLTLGGDLRGVTHMHFSAVPCLLPSVPTCHLLLPHQ